MAITRRRFLTSAVGSAAWGLGVATLPRNAALAKPRGPALVSLPSIDATAGKGFALSAITGRMEFIPGVASPTLGWNQGYLGPVVRVSRGTDVAASVENKTQAPISVHWHGLLVPGDSDGGPHQPIAAGETWRPRLTIDQPPATLWYHAHLHRETAPQVYAGLAGVLLVEDGKDGARGLPTTPDVDDLVLVLQDKRFNAAGEAVYEPGAADLMHGFLGEAILVNGQLTPVAAVPAGVVRLRLVNASNARIYELSFSDQRSIALIATDQGFLPRPVVLSRLRLAPGERVEVLVDFGDGDAATLTSEPHAETRGMMPMGGMMHDMLPSPESFTAGFPILDFTVDASLPAMVTTVPETLDAADTKLAVPVTTRSFVLNDMGMMMGGGMMGGMMGMARAGTPAFGINGRPFDMARLDLDVALGTTERWLVGGQMMGHPFHIHGVRFRVESDGGLPPRPENSGWKDTVLVEGEAALLVDFRHPATPTKPFMMHCHILEHEDAGMMAQFAVA